MPGRRLRRDGNDAPCGPSDARQDFDRWRRGRSVEELVRDSFAFLLEREPKQSILNEFDLPAIKRYFPDYEGG